MSKNVKETVREVCETWQEIFGAIVIDQLRVQQEPKSPLCGLFLHRVYVRLCLWNFCLILPLGRWDLLSTWIGIGRKVHTSKPSLPGKLV